MGPHKEYVRDVRPVVIAGAERMRKLEQQRQAVPQVMKEAQKPQVALAPHEIAQGLQRLSGV